MKSDYATRMMDAGRCTECSVLRGTITRLMATVRETRTRVEELERELADRDARDRARIAGGGKP